MFNPPKDRQLMGRRFKFLFRRCIVELVMILNKQFENVVKAGTLTLSLQHC